MRPYLFHRLRQQTTCGLKQVVSARRCMSQFDGFRQRLQQYQSGRVELTKDADTGIAVLTLSNPGRKNAISGSMMVELADHVTELSQWQEGKGVVVRGADQTFCSGGDLKTLMSVLDSEASGVMSHFMQDTLTRLRCLPLVSLALLEGMAIGGGAELAMACDVRAMTDSARVGFVQVKMGLTTGWGGGTHLMQQVGRRRTLELLGSMKVLRAPEALDWGLVHHTLPPDTPPLQAAHHLLTDNYCRGPVEVVRAVKEVVMGVERSSSVGEALEAERKVFVSLWNGPHQLAALHNNIKHS